VFDCVSSTTALPRSRNHANLRAPMMLLGCGARGAPTDENGAYGNGTYDTNLATSEFKNETTMPSFPIRQRGFSTSRAKKVQKRNHLKIASKSRGRQVDFGRAVDPHPALSVKGRGKTVRCAIRGNPSPCRISLASKAARNRLSGPFWLPHRFRSTRPFPPWPEKHRSCQETCG